MVKSTLYYGCEQYSNLYNHGYNHASHSSKMRPMQLWPSKNCCSLELRWLPIMTFPAFCILFSLVSAWHACRVGYHGFCVLVWVIEHWAVKRTTLLAPGINVKVSMYTVWSHDNKRAIETLCFELWPMTNLFWPDQWCLHPPVYSQRDFRQVSMSFCWLFIKWITKHFLLCVCFSHVELLVSIKFIARI